MHSVENAQVGDHLCWAYSDEAAFREGLSHYVRDGLAAGQRVVCYVPARTFEATRRRLEETVPGMGEAVEHTALVLGVSEDAYLPGGTFDPDFRVAGYAEMAQRAVADGFTALRVMGEATEILNTSEARERWPGYELRADLLAARLPVVALCAYDVRRCEPGALALVRAMHASSLGDWESDLLFSLHANASGSLSLRGEVDFGSSEAVGRVAREAAVDVSDPVLDLSELRFIDVAGVRAVAEGARAIAGAHSRVRISGAGPTFTRIWDLLGCGRQFDAELELV